MTNFFVCVESVFNYITGHLIMFLTGDDAEAISYEGKSSRPI